MGAVSYDFHQIARICTATLLGLFVAAEPDLVFSQTAVRIIGDDTGGALASRVLEVQALRATHTRVEIRGSYCYSACTMYLGVNDVCVSPTTVFGFHGPSGPDGPLELKSFENWSRVMARHYVEPLARWYIQEARYETASIVQVKGQNLIDLGYQSC